MHVRTDSLSKRYRRRPALQGVSVEIAPGQIVALLGLNGAGKSTFLQCLAGLTGPDRGEIYYDGVPFRREDIPLRRRLFFLPDTPFFLWNETVVRNLAVMLRHYEADGPGAEDRLLALLEEFDVLACIHALPQELSRGQAYKVGLCALLAIDPELWLCDEPLASGMDPLGLAAYRRHVRSAAARGRTILYSTQILELAQSFSDRALILNEGRVCAFDSLPNLIAAAPPAGAPGETPLTALFQQLRDVSA